MVINEKITPLLNITSVVVNFLFTFFTLISSIIYMQKLANLLASLYHNKNCDT